MRNGLTIGQAAAFTGVTIKTVRHYHWLGLIDEPERDSSGYRRYRSTDLLRLVQVRTLAGAGVPLAKIGAMLDANPERFAAALADVEQHLTDRIDELIERRRTLRGSPAATIAVVPVPVTKDAYPGKGRHAAHTAIERRPDTARSAYAAPSLRPPVRPAAAC
jgi:MerR family transcriptional regulator, thiopeptide resistance regulator